MTPDDFKSNVLASPQVRAIADHSHDGRRWMMPSRLPDTASEGSRNLWNHLSARPGYEVRSPLTFLMLMTLSDDDYPL